MFQPLFSLLFSLFASRTLGIEIAEDSVRLVELGYFQKQYQLLKYAVFPKQVDWQLLASTQGFYPHRTVLGISPTHAMPYTVLLKAHVKSYQTSLISAIEEKLLIAHDTFEVASRVISKQHDQLEIEALVLRKEILSRLRTPLQETNFQLFGIETTEHAITRFHKNNGFDTLRLKLSPEEREHFEHDKALLETASGLAMLPQHEKTSLIFKTKKYPSWFKIAAKLSSIASLLLATFCLMLKSPAPSIHSFKPFTPVSLILNKPPFHYQIYALKDLKRAGFLQNAQKTIGLIQTPDGEIQNIYVGDYLGQEHALVQEITDKHIIVLNKNRKIIL